MTIVCDRGDPKVDRPPLFGGTSFTSFPGSAIREYAASLEKVLPLISKYLLRRSGALLRQHSCNAVLTDERFRLSVFGGKPPEM